MAFRYFTKPSTTTPNSAMEPITYMITLSAAIVAAAFYLQTSKTFSYEALHAATGETRKRALYAKQGFDLAEYERIGKQVTELEEWIEGIRASYD